MLTKDNRWKKGKSYQKYCYTVQDISKLTGKAIQTIRNDVCQNKLDLNDIVSVSEYIKKVIKRKRDIKIKQKIKKIKDDFDTIWEASIK